MATATSVRPAASQCPASGNCSGNGTCADGLSGAGTCTCSAGWTGTDCSLTDTDSDGVADGSDCASTNATIWRDQAYVDADGDGVRESTTSTMSCPVNVCTTSSTASTNNNLKKLSKALYQEALNAKLAAVSACPSQPRTGSDRRNNTMDDFSALRKALRNVPATLTACN